MKRNAMLSLLLLAALPLSGFAANNTPVGTWQTIDDETGKPKAVVQISQNGDTLEGQIVKLYRDPQEDPNPLCQACKGDKKDQPIIGMTILSGLQQSGNEWVDGEILDPQNGKVYSAKASLDDNGQKLKVRGFIGFSLIGRTQTWERQ